MRILFATDGSEGSDVALDLLLSLPHRLVDRFDVASVPVHHHIGGTVEGTGAYVTELVEAEMETAHHTALEAALRLKARGIDADTHVTEGIAAADAIIATAKRLRSDLIVVGTRGLGRIAGAILGSTARALAKHSPVPVMVVRERREAPRRILIATDGSPDARFVISALASMPLPDRAEVTLLNVVPGTQREFPVGRTGDELRAVVEREERSASLEILRMAAEQLPAHVSVRLEIRRGDPAGEIARFAGAMGADLVVLGSRGMTLGGGFLQGSTADRVLSSVHCAVLVARAPVPADRPMREEEVLAATAG